MADYNKLNIKFSNFGLNLTHDPISLPFGKYALLTNMVSTIEGNLRPRKGWLRGHVAAVTAAGSILNFRKLNNSAALGSSFIARHDTSASISSTTTPPFTFNLLSGLTAIFSTSAGSIITYRPSISGTIWAYIFDKTAMRKTDGTNVHPIGYTRATTDVSLAQTTGGSLTLLGTYYYRWSYYASTTGAESLYNNNSSSDQGISLTGSNNRVNVTVPAGTVQTGVTHVRIYRKGGTINTWRRIVTTDYVGSAITHGDTTSDVAVSALTVQDEVSDRPFTTTNTSNVDVPGVALPYAADPYLGYILACGDPTNTGYVYWTNKFDPDRQDPSNRVEVSSPQDPVQNVFIYNGRPFVFTKEALYELFVGLSTLSTFTPSKTACGHGLFAPLAFTVGPEIYFLSKDGIYSTGGGSEVSLTDDELRPLFNNQTVNGYAPIDFTATDFVRMAYHKNEVWFSYRGTDALTHYMIYDIIYRRWRASNLRFDSQAIYAEEEAGSRLWVGTTNGFIQYETGASDEGGSPNNSIPVELTTGIITLNAPLIHKEWGHIIFDLDPQSTTVTISAYKDKGTTLISTYSTAASSRTKLYCNLGPTFSEDLQIDIAWSSNSATPILYGYELLYRKDEPEMSHWSITGVTHNLEGWQIVRSAYMTLRSSVAITMTVSVLSDDGSSASQTYTIPSTAGAKAKIFVPFNATKGKIFSYALSPNSASSAFRLYPDQCEVHVKPWITSMGYRPVNPFIGGGDMTGQEGINTAGPGLSAMPRSGGGGGSTGGGLANALGGSDVFDFLGGGGPAIPPPGTQGGESTPDTIIGPDGRSYPREQAGELYPHGFDPATGRPLNESGRPFIPSAGSYDVPNTRDD